MTGICGIVSNNIDAGQFRDACRRVSAIPGAIFKEETYSSDNCEIIHLSRADSDGSYIELRQVGGHSTVLMLEGELYSLPRSAPGQLGPSQGNDRKSLLALYLERGADFVDLIDGEFNIVIYEPAYRRLTILNDHIASYPMYYWKRDDKLLFASEKKCLLAATIERRRIDPVGLLQLFMHQHNLADRTLLEDVRRLPPSSHLIYSDGKLCTSRRSRRYGHRSLPRRPAEVLQLWGDHLRTAIAKRVEGKDRLLFSLSAGLDSRAVACAIDRTKRPIVARTWGTDGSREVEYAREIARRLHFDHLVESPKDYFLSNGIHYAVWRTDGEIESRHTLSVFTHTRMKECGDHVIGGWLGDVSSGAHLRPFSLAPMNRKRFIGEAFKRYTVFPKAILGRVFNQTFLSAHLDEVRDAFFESFNDYQGASNARAYELWDLEHRQTRMTISSMPADSHLFGKIRPFFDRSYLEFVMSLPMHWRIGQNLYKSLIYAIGPEVRSIRNANTDIQLYSSPAANLGALSMRKLAQRLIKPTDSRPTLDFGEWTRRDRGLRRILDSFITSEYCDETVFNRRGIHQVVEQHYNSSFDHSILVNLLATYAVALKYFVYEQIQTCPEEAQGAS